MQGIDIFYFIFKWPLKKIFSLGLDAFLAPMSLTCLMIHMTVWFGNLLVFMKLQNVIGTSSNFYNCKTMFNVILSEFKVCFNLPVIYSSMNRRKIFIKVYTIAYYSCIYTFPLKKLIGYIFLLLRGNNRWADIVVKRGSFFIY